MKNLIKDKLKSVSSKAENLTGHLAALKAKGGLTMLPPDATATEKFKFDLCKKVVVYMHEQKMDKPKLSQALKISISDAESITGYRLDTLRVDDLLDVNEQINPGVKFKVA